VNEGADESARIARQPATQVVVLMLGGATYSEAEAVRKFNTARRRAERRSNAVLGASLMLNTETFVQRIRQLSNS
jgi:Sec1 family